MNKLTLFLTLITCLSYGGPYTVETWVGNGSAGDQDGKLNEARLRSPTGVCRDKEGNFYIADCGNNKIKKVDPEGNVTTLAGSGTAGYRDGSSSIVQFSQPFGVCVDDEGIVYVGDFGSNTIRKVSTSGSVTTLAGGSQGYQDGAANSARFYSPRGVAVDNKLKSIYVGDSWNHRVRKIDLSTNQVSTYAGGGSTGLDAGDLADGQGDAARFHTPCGLSIDSAGNIYVGDAFNHRVRKVGTDRSVITVAGTGSTGDGNGGFQDGDTSVARLNTCTKVFVTNNGFLLIGDTYGNRVRMVDTSGNVSTLAGTGSAGYQNGADSVSRFNYPRGIVANDNLDSIFVIDYNNHSMRFIWKEIVTAADFQKTNQPINFGMSFNQAKGVLTIELFQVKGACNIDIYTICGRLMYHKSEIAETQLKVSVSKFSSGTYLIRIKSDNLEMVGKLLIPN